MKIKYQLIYVSLVFSLFGCQKGYNKAKIEKDIYNAIAKECLSSSDCVINISKITTFDWDELFVINAGTRSDEVSKIIGIEYPSSDNYTRRRYIFLKDKVIVYKEDIKYDPSAPINGIVIFGNPFELPKYNIYKKNSLFKITEIRSSKSHFYILEPYLKK